MQCEGIVVLDVDLNARSLVGSNHGCSMSLELVWGKSGVLDVSLQVHCRRLSWTLAWPLLNLLLVTVGLQYLPWKGEDLKVSNDGCWAQNCTEMSSMEQIVERLFKYISEACTKGSNEFHAHPTTANKQLSSFERSLSIPIHRLNGRPRGPAVGR